HHVARMAKGKDDLRIWEQSMNQRHTVHCQWVLVHEQLAGTEWRQARGRLEISVAGGADLVIGRPSQRFEVAKLLLRAPKHRLFFEDLGVWMPHQERVEQSRAGARETNEE